MHRIDTITCTGNVDEVLGVAKVKLNSGNETTILEMNFPGSHQYIQMISLLKHYEGLFTDRYSQDNWRAGVGNSNALSNDVVPFLYGKGITADAKVFIKIRGIPVPLKRFDLSKHGELYNSVFRFPDYLFGFEDASLSVENLIFESTDSKNFSYKNGSFSKKIPSKKNTEFNLNLIKE